MEIVALSRRSSRINPGTISLQEGFVRRSIRDPQVALLSSPDVQHCLQKIRTNDEDSIVLKIKDNIRSDLNPTVLAHILNALSKNKVCQALYAQNINAAMDDEQFYHLIDVLKQKRIWALNIGENYRISPKAWETFCEALPATHLTHLYISEHVITNDLKTRIRGLIRLNRKKHKRHCSIQNLKVIRKCTNLWWNPINTIKHRIDKQIAHEALKRKLKENAAKSKNNNSKRNISTNNNANQSNNDSNITKKSNGKRKKNDNDQLSKKNKKIKLDETDVEFWAEGYGRGGNQSWKFSCICGEICSSYENPLYHPEGDQIQCDACKLWSHLRCITERSLGSVSNIEEDEFLCHVCKAAIRRQLKAEAARSF